MTDPWLKLAADKLIPLLLVVLAGVAYVLKLPDAYCGAVAGAGLLAFQVSPKSPQ